MSALYDAIGDGYTRRRRADPRLAAALWAALGDATTLVNVGAGSGSYEPSDRNVVAVEPSAVMLAQRSAHAAPAVCARAEALPFADGAFDGALAVLTIHHWADQARGLAECARVARERVVLLTWDPASDGFWLVREYFPELLAHDRTLFPRLDAIAAVLGELEVCTLPIPADCVDGFLGAFWQRPAAYLDPAERAGMSSFARVADPAAQLDRLRADIDSGAWAARHASLMGRTELDVGYRVVIAPPVSHHGAPRSVDPRCSRVAR